MSFVSSNIQILGCGNTLKGDDGFGPYVAEYLENNYEISDGIAVLDAGLACGEWIVPLLHDEDRPSKLIIVDVLDMGLEPGTLKILTPDTLKIANNTFSYSSHFFPDKVIFDQMVETGMEIIFICCQLKEIPRDLSMQLTDELKPMVAVAAEEIAKLVGMKKLSS